MSSVHLSPRVEPVEPVEPGKTAVWFVHIRNEGSRHHAERDEYVLITLRVMVPSIANLISSVVRALVFAEKRVSVESIAPEY